MMKKPAICKPFLKFLKQEKLPQVKSYQKTELKIKGSIKPLHPLKSIFPLNK